MKYRIENTRSGIVLGEYDAESKSDALDAMARDAGYRNYAEAVSVAPGTDILVTPLE